MSSTGVVRSFLEQRSVSKQATRGERLLGRLFPNRGGVGWPGGWGQDRLQQVQHMKNWSFVAIDAIASMIGQLQPNCAAVGHARPGHHHKDSQDWRHRAIALNDSRRGHYVKYADNALASQLFSVPSYHTKSLSVVKPHEELIPLEADHPLQRLIDNPNPIDTPFDLQYELSMFLDLTGVGYEWCVPNDYGVPCESWVIPSHWVWPRMGCNKYVNPEHPDADRMIEYYEVRPWGGIGSAGMLRIPVDEVIQYSWKSPLNKIDGFSKMQAVSQWIDVEESIGKSRWAQMINQARPEFWVELGEGMEDPDDDKLARIEQKFATKYAGEWNYGKPLISPPGAKATVLSFTPAEMCYKDSEEQIRDMILSAFRVPGAAVGLVKEMTFGSILATIQSMCTWCVNPRLVMMGQRKTKFLASRFSTPERPVRIWWDDCTPPDPAQVNADVTTDLACILPGQELQGRVIGGSKAWYSGETVEIVTRSGVSLVVTPNHPIATVKGFVPAGQLQEGQHLLRHVERVSLSSKHDVKHAPAVVEKVFESLCRMPNFSSGEVTASVVDFHGDASGFNGKVQVVGSYCKLGRNDVAKSAKNVGESRFVISDLVERALGRLSHLDFAVNCHFSWSHISSSSGNAGLASVRPLYPKVLGSDLGSCDFSSSLKTKPLPPFLPNRFEVFFSGTNSVRLGTDGSTEAFPFEEQLRHFGLTADRNAGTLESFPEPSMAHANIGSDFLDGFAGSVDGSEPFHVGHGFGDKFLSFGAASQFDTSLTDFLGDGVNADTFLAGDGSNCFAGKIALDEIVEIRKVHWDGPVYDFESPVGFIVVNCLCVSNCAAITPNEIRALRGRKPYRFGGDDPMVQGPGGLVPYPMQTGDNMQDIADLIPVMGPQNSVPPPPGGTENELPQLTHEPEDIPNELPDGNPNIDEPNGEPSKAWVEKSANLDHPVKVDPIDLHLPDLSQHEPWSCGAAALFAVASYFGAGPESEREWIDLLGTNEEGTTPQAIIRVAAELGLDVHAMQGMTLNDLEDELKAGRPVLVTIQAYSSGGEQEEESGNDSGHWCVVVGMDLERVYVEDPELHGERGELPLEQFVRRWHDVGADGKPYVRYGISFWRAEEIVPVKSIRKDAAFHEEDHPRANDGKFGSGGGSSAGTSIHQRAVSGAKKTLAKFKEAYAKIKSAPVLKQVDAAGGHMKATTKKLYSKLEGRYGRKTALAIMASGSALDWGTVGAGAAMGIPLWLPGASIWGTLPGVALAETYLQIRKGAGRLLSKGEMSGAELKRLGKQFAENLMAAYGKYLADHEDEIKPLVKTDNKPTNRLTKFLRPHRNGVKS